MAMAGKVKLLVRNTSVLSMFMAASGRKTGRLPEPPFAVQIDTTIHLVKFRSNSWFSEHGARFNRTLLNKHITSCDIHLL